MSASVSLVKGIVHVREPHDIVYRLHHARMHQYRLAVSVHGTDAVSLELFSTSHCIGQPMSVSEFLDKYFGTCRYRVMTAMHGMVYTNNTTT